MCPFSRTKTLRVVALLAFGFCLVSPGIRWKQIGLLTTNLFDQVNKYITGSKAASRIQLLKSRCQIPLLKIITGLTADHSKVDSRILIDPHNNLSYCHVPKIGSTFWFSAFAILTADDKEAQSPYKLWKKYGENLHEKVKVKFLKQIRRENRKLWLESGKLFLFVRDPYARLLSAYVDKFLSPNQPYWTRIGKVIIRHFRQNASSTSLRCGHDVTFEEFLRYFVASESTLGWPISDHHWTPIYKLCAPCQYDYHFIGKTETFVKDTVDLIQSTNLGQKIDFQSGSANEIKAVIEDKIDKFLNHSLSLGDCLDIKNDMWRLTYSFAEKGYIKHGTQIPEPSKALTAANKNNYFKLLTEKILEVHNNQSKKGTRREYRDLAFLEAYRHIPLDLLRSVRDVLLPDFLLFGYDPQPEGLFPVHDQLYKNDIV